MVRTIPVIDLSAARHGTIDDRRAVARTIDRTCREVGFFTVTGARRRGSDHRRAARQGA
jgi:isopenicillin N synthase-like dioxygenase